MFSNNTTLYVILLLLVSLTPSTLSAQCDSSVPPGTQLTLSGNEYAFRWQNGGGSLTDIGLLFCEDQNQYQFKRATGGTEFYVNPIDNVSSFRGRVGISTNSPKTGVDLQVVGRSQFGAPSNFTDINDEGDLSFSGSADYLVGDDRYVFRIASDESQGLFYNEAFQRYEYRGTGGSSVFHITSSGFLSTQSGLKLGNTSTASSGAIRWNGTDFEGYDGSSWQSFTSGGSTTDSDWNISGSNMYSGVSGNIGIGITSPASKVHIDNGDLQVSGGSLVLNNTGIWGIESNGIIESDLGITVQLDADDNSTIAGFAVRNSESQDVFTAFESGIVRAHNELIVDHKLMVGDIGPISEMIRAEGNPDSTGNIIHAQTNYNGFTDVRAFKGESITEPGYGIGGEFIGGWRGVYGYANSSAYTGTSYGVYGRATGSSAGTRIGIYGTATGGNVNWAAFFGSGDVYVQNDLMIGNSAGAAGYRLAVDGKIMCEELAVQNSTAWPDYVFEADYKLTSLKDLEAQIETLGHLPGVPSAAQVEAEGAKVGEVQTILLEKVEELTLYVIDLQKQIEALENK